MRAARRSRDFVGVAEAAYRAEPSDQAWLAGVVESLAPVLGDAEGVLGTFVNAVDHANIEVVAAAAVGASDGVLAASAAMQEHAGASAAMRERFLQAGPVSSLRRTLGRASPLLADLSHAHGVHDALYVWAGDPVGLLCAFSSPSRRTLPLPRHHLWSLERVAAHVASGLRLRRCAGRARSGAGHAPGEAVLTPAGDVAHATGPAATPGGLAALRRAALRSERARGPLRRRDADEALALWTALVRGRWAVVDHFDSDGRRYLVARRNEPMFGREGRGLTWRERQVASLAARGHANKLIAYELGLSLGTVHTYLARAQGKLGLPTRVHLIRALLAGC